MAKFKVGDIIVANEMSNTRYYHPTKRNGWTGIVLGVKGKGLIYVKTITPESYKDTEFDVEEEYFDLVQGNHIKKHIVNKNTVLVILTDNRKGVAKCSPDDKFNIAFGTALAVARAYGDKETEAKLLAEPSEPVKEEPTFKVGELVRIRQWDDMAKEFGIKSLEVIMCQCGFIDVMKPLCGKYAEIVRLNGSLVELKFSNCDDLDTSWEYSTDMIEKV